MPESSHRPRSRPYPDDQCHVSEETSSQPYGYAGQNSTARPHPPCIDQAANHSGTLSSSLSSLSILNGNAFPAKIDKIEILPKALELGRLRVVLVSTRNPLNIGAAARAMSNFGFSQLRLVNPYEAAFRQATSAVGAADLMAN